MRFAKIILLYLFPVTCFAQIPSESRTIYTRKEGMSNNTVTSIVKDGRGFLWIGTGEGLNRFDGNQFVNYFSDDNDFSTLAGNNIYDILPYQPGRLLIATNNGVSVFNTLTNHFENEKMTVPDLKKGSGIYIRSFFQDRQGRVFINYSGEIDVFTKDLQFLYRLTDTYWGRSLKGIIIYNEHWMQDRQGRIWMPSDNSGVCILDEANRQVYSSKNNPLHYTFLKLKPVRSFYYDEDEQEVFLSHWGEGLEKHNIKTGKISYQNFHSVGYGEVNTINAITRKNDRLICCGTQGVYSLDPRTMQYENIFADLHDPGTSFIDSYTLLNDQENIWIGTESKGLFKISQQSSLVRQIPLPYKIQNYAGTCTGILQTNKNKVYLACGDEGLEEVDLQHFKLTRYTLYDAMHKPSYITRITQYDAKNVLVATFTGFYLFDHSAKTFRRCDRFPSYTNQLNVASVFMDSKENVWSSYKAPTALSFYNKTTGEFSYFPEYVVNGKKVFNAIHLITRITEDKYGKIWMVSSKASGEMTAYDPATGVWNTYPKAGRTAKFFAGKELNGFCVVDSIIWAANAYGLGLLRYDYHTDSVRRIGRTDGLLSDNIFSITRDKQDNLFISTASGINYYNTGTNEIRTLIVNDGSINWGFGFAQYFDTLNNQLIYGLNDRILVANEKLWDKPVEDSLLTYIDDILVNNTLHINNQSVIRLDYNQKNISIRFTSIHYSGNAGLLYSYKMNGLDKEWTLSREANTTNYSNLPPGSYHFLVRAKVESGKWGPVNESTWIVIRPAFWQTAGFWMLTFLLIGLSTMWLVRRRIRNIRGAAELKQKLAETEMLALRSQMNPHFIFNCLSAIDNLMQTNQADKATTYLNRFAKLIRALLENSKNNVVSFHKDLETLTLYLQMEQFRAGNKFSFDLQADQELVNGDYKIPPLIVQPFVENAIQHGLLNRELGERKLKIEARLQGDYIQYRISDNGVGRTMAADIKKRNRPEHISYGIQITTERLQLHNHHTKEQDIIITDLYEQGKPAGTQVDVLIRIDH